MSTAYCHECDEVTGRNKDGQCVECAHDAHKERVAWSRLLRKLVTMGFGLAAILGINWLMASHFSGDDVARAGLSGVVNALCVWFGSSLKAEEKVR